MWNNSPDDMEQCSNLHVTGVHLSCNKAEGNKVILLGFIAGLRLFVKRSIPHTSRLPKPFGYSTSHTLTHYYICAHARTLLTCNERLETNRHADIQYHAPLNKSRKYGRLNYVKISSFNNAV